MESDSVKLIEFHDIGEGSEHAFEYHRNKKNGSMYESFGADRELMVQVDSNLDQSYISFEGFVKMNDFVFEPERLLRHQYPAPPPKLHYSTQWRKLTKKLYRNSSNATN